MSDNNKETNVFAGLPTTLICFILGILIWNNTTDEGARLCSAYMQRKFVIFNTVANSVCLGVIVLFGGCMCFNLTSEGSGAGCVGFLGFSTLISLTVSLVGTLVYYGIFLYNEPEFNSGVYEESYTSWTADCNYNITNDDPNYIHDTKWYDMLVDYPKVLCIIITLSLIFIGGCGGLFCVCGSCGILCNKK